MVQISELSKSVPPHAETENHAVPNQHLAVGSSGVDSGAITEDSIDSEQSDADPIDAPSGFAADSTVPNELVDESLSTMAPVPPNWQSERTQRSRQIGLVVALSAAGVLGAIGLFGWFVKNWNDGEPVAVTRPIDSKEEPVAEVGSQEQPVTSEPVTDGMQELAADDQADIGSETTTVVEDPGPAEPNVEHPLESEIPPAEIPNDMKPEGIIPADMRPDNPLVPIGTNDSNETDSEAAPKLDGPVEMPEEAKGLMDIFNMGDGKEKLPALETPATVDDIEIEGPKAENIDPMLIANPPEPINFKSALAIKMAIATPKDRGYPLNDLTSLLSQISGVPIQIDWVSFDLVGTNIRDRVKLKGKGFRPLGDYLQQTAEAVNGRIVQQETMVVLQPSDTAMDERMAELLDLSDLGAGEVSATATLNAFLAKGNGKKLQVGEETWDKQIAALAADAMRRMRSVKPKVDDVRFSRWAQSSMDPKLDWPKLGVGDPGPQYPSPVAMTGLFRRLSRRNQATCFVNWIDANRRGMSPEQLVMPHIGSAPKGGPGGKPDVGAVLDGVLQPFDLHVRQVDSQHWWVGTESSYDLFPVLVWTPPLGKEQARFTQRINQAMVGQTEFPFRMSVDADSGRALLLIPRFIVRQLPKIQMGLNLTRTN